MAATPPWMRGRDVSVLTITGATEASNGDITDGSTTAIQPLVAIWDEYDFDSDPNQEEISSAGTQRMNHVILQENNSVRISVPMERVVRSGAGANDKVNPLDFLVRSFDLLKVVLTHSGRTVTYYGRRGRYSERIRKGKSTHELSLTMADIGSANPAYS